MKTFVHISLGTYTLNIVININGATFRNTQNQDPMQQEEKIRQMMSEMCKHFFENMANNIPSQDIPHSLERYLQSRLEVEVKAATEGSLRITVECRTLEILERLWEDYSSGHLNAVAENCLLTDDIKRRYNVLSVNLKTTILEEDYLACKRSLLARELIIKNCFIISLSIYQRIK